MRCRAATFFRATALSPAVAIAAGGAACAGPWAREAGDVFLSFSVSAEEDQLALIYGPLDPDRYYSAYGEIGLGRRLTFGVDLGRGEASSLTVGFLRYTLTPPDATWQFAVDGGYGRREVDGQPDADLVRLGLSVGRGIGEGGGRWYMPLSHQGGWTSLDASVLYDPDTDDRIWQVEATLGLTLTERLTAVMALKAEEWPGADPMLTARPSVVVRLTDRFAVQAGAHAGLMGSDEMGLSLSLWQDF